MFGLEVLCVLSVLYLYYKCTDEVLQVDNMNEYFSQTLIAGPDLPKRCLFAKMITSPEGDGVILLGTRCKSQIKGNITQEFYQLKPISDGTFEWIALSKKLMYDRIDPIMVYIDESKVNCYIDTTTENPDVTTEEATTEALTTTSPTTSTMDPRIGISGRNHGHV